MASLTSRMEALEGENSTLKKKLIESMHEVNTLKESSKTLRSEEHTSELQSLLLLLSSLLLKL